MTTIRTRLQMLIQRLRSGSFLGNVLILAGGTGLGQLIVVLATPILTRLYGPEEFGVLTVFVSVLTILLSISALRYDIAIPLPEEESAAINLVALGFLVASSFSLLSGVVSRLLRKQVEVWLPTPQMMAYLWWLLPVALFAGSVYQIAVYWHVRKKRFSRLSQARVSQSLASAGAQLGMGLLSAGSIGLTGGYALGQITAGGVLFGSLVKEDRGLLHQITRNRIKDAAFRYRRFPLISSWSALLNSGGLQLPSLLLLAFFGAATAGWFGLAQRVMGIPISLIGYSVSQVYLGEASRLRNENPEAMRQLFLRTATRLFIFVGVPMMIGGGIAPWAFGFIFGEQWRASGWFIIALLPMFLGQVVAMPLSQSLNILERQDLQLYWDAARVLFVTLSLSSSYYYFHLGAMATLTLYSVVMFLMYVVYLTLMYRQISLSVSKWTQS